MRVPSATYYAAVALLAGALACGRTSARSGDESGAAADTASQDAAGSMASPGDTAGPGTSTSRATGTGSGTSATQPSDSAKGNQTKSGVTDTRTGKSTLGPGVTQTRPDQNQPVTSKGDTVARGGATGTSGAGNTGTSGTGTSGTGSSTGQPGQ